MRLAYVAHLLPGSLDERVEHARRLGLAVEVADGIGPDVTTWRRAGLEVPTLAAWGMHELHPLHRDADARAASVGYVLGVLERAARAHVPNVLTACGFHPASTERVRARCLDFYGALAPRARELGVRILIEPLSPLRAGALNEPADVDRLIVELGDDVFATALDTGHLLDARLDPGEVLRTWRSPVNELQLRGADSRPPSPRLPFASWIAAHAELEVVTIEHRETIAVPALNELVASVRR